METERSYLRKLERRSRITNWILLLGFSAIGASSITGISALESRYGLPDACSLASDAITTEAVVKQYQQCKSKLVGIDLERQDRQFKAIATQLPPSEQLTDNTKKVFDAVFDDIRNQHYNQRPEHIKLISVLLCFLFFVWFLIYIALLFNFDMFNSL